jgi:phosphomannomutase/phosphomannomutase/phosphoglucomutase
MAAVETLNCFKAYDIRGKLGSELNEDIAYRIGYAFAKQQHAKVVVVGGDIRHSSHALKLAVARGLIDAGADVIDIGMVGTEEIYFASFYLDVDGGIEVTASHNPIDYNGMKLVGRGAVPISGDSGLHDIKTLAEQMPSPQPEVLNADIEHSQRYSQYSILQPYSEHLLSYITPSNLRPLRLVVNAGNGAAGHVIDTIESTFQQQGIPVEFIKVHHEPDGSFPNGIPNPLLPENRAATADAIIENNADMGIAWDGDFDRCFLFDENGRFIEGYYIVGLLAETFLLKHPGEKIIHDPRLTWNTIDQVREAGGTPIQSKTGHAFIKERMRKENAIYGGEMSAHHYFRDFAFCDSGMIPWLLVSELVSLSDASLSSLVNERMTKYPCSGEINFQVDDIPTTINKITDHYTSSDTAFEYDRTIPKLDYTDGISLEFEEWRFNLRASNTEPLIRLNLETTGDQELLSCRLRELESLIKQ